MTSVARRREHEDSLEYSDASQDNDQSNSGNDGTRQESDYDSNRSESDLSEREQDAQEGERKVDDDEDRSNPQYIPKRGTFYEHDDRTAASGEETSNNTTSETVSDKKDTSSEAPSERRRPPRKSETIDKWSHDKYNENEQMPKSREELVAIYGYDIRNEEAPPHARRNRRYGRGPNKYTRTWEDEEAYRRQAAAAPPQPRRAPRLEEFPEIGAGRISKRRPSRTRSKSQPPSNESSENGSALRRNASIKTPRAKAPFRQAKPVGKPVGRERAKENNVISAMENLSIANVNNNSGPPQRKINMAPVAQQRPVPTVQQKKPLAPTQVQNTSSNKPSVQPTPPTGKLPQQTPAQTVNKTELQPGQESRGSKRYSSLRQRPLAEPYQPQAQANNNLQQNIYHSEYPSASPQQINSHTRMEPAAATAHQQNVVHQAVHASSGVTPTQHGPSPPLQHNQQAVLAGMLEQQLAAAAAAARHAQHLHTMPPQQQQHTMPSIPPSQGYAPPAMMPAQFMQAGTNPVYGGQAMYAPPAAPYQQHATHPQHAQHTAQHVAPHPAQHVAQHPAQHVAQHAPPHPPHGQIYPHHNYATTAGGVTYYSTSEQELLGATVRPSRRPTAAIPIVPPNQNRQANSAEKDNIDRIVENMFVRKPWPAQGAESKEKSQTDSRTSQEKESQSNSLTSSTESRPSVDRSDPKPDPEEDTKATEEPRVEEQKLPGPSESTRAPEVTQSSEEVASESINTDA